MANSAGWNWIGPSASQLRLPLTLWPNGMTAASSSTETMIVGKARRFHVPDVERGSRHPAATAPSTAKSSWRRKTV